ncbi:zinc finger, CCHC-type containing protein, partial [Tanacetum coccineum]
MVRRPRVEARFDSLKVLLFVFKATGVVFLLKGFDNRIVVRFMRTKCNGWATRKGVLKLSFCPGTCNKERLQEGLLVFVFLEGVEAILLGLPSSSTKRVLGLSSCRDYQQGLKKVLVFLVIKDRWLVRMMALLEQQGLASALEELPATIIAAYDQVIQKKAYSTLILCLGDRLVGDLAAIDTAISDEDKALLLLTYLPSSYDNFVETLLYSRDTLKLEDVLATLNSRELQKMTEAKGDGGEWLYVRGRSGQRGMEQGTDSVWLKSQGISNKLGCYICQSEEHLKRDCPRYNHKKSQGFVRNKDQVSSSGADEHGNANVMMTMSAKELLDWIMDSGGSYHITYKRDYLFDLEEYDGGNILLGDGRECHIRGD